MGGNYETHEGNGVILGGPGGGFDPGLRSETLAQGSVLPGRRKYVDQLLADGGRRI
jgi:hypothetical protein